MTGLDSTTDLDDFYLDILGQRPRINKLYTQLTFCFPLPDESTHLQPDIINPLMKGIEKLSANFPWIAGKVVNDDGSLKIKRSEKPLRLIVKDLSHDRSDINWGALQRANFPFSMLDETILAPCKTFVYPDEPSLGLPVFLVQATLIAGGLLLTFNAQHGSMDMTGQAQVIYLLAKACRNEPFTPSELSVGNMGRRNIVPLLDEGNLGTELDHQVSKDTPDKGGQPADHQPLPPFENPEKKDQRAPSQSLPPKVTWAYFAFSAASLAALKSLVMKTMIADDFVSTDDILSAFVWQSVTRARLPRLGDPSTLRTTLSRAVDVRRALSLPSTYPGLLSNATFITFTIDEVVKHSLSSIALMLRNALKPESLIHHLRTLATSISSHGNAADKVGFANTSVPELDVRLSSWAKEKCYDFDFGFGKPKAVRRPRFGKGSREGLVYFLPKRLDGEIVAGVCLRDDDLDRLKEDKDFAEFGTYIG